jgi:hypothetical protein
LGCLDVSDSNSHGPYDFAFIVAPTCVKAASHTAEIVTWLAHGFQNEYSSNQCDGRG